MKIIRLSRRSGRRRRRLLSPSRTNDLCSVNGPGECDPLLRTLDEGVIH